MVIESLAGLAVYASSCTGLCSYIQSPYLLGTEIAMLAVMVVVGILAIMYTLSPFIGRSDLRTWIRVKLYDEFSAIIFILIFLAFGTLVVTFPVVTSFNSVGLVPAECEQAATAPMSYGLTGPTTDYNNLYFLAVCDLSDYNQAVNHFSEYSFYLSVLISIAPLTTFNFPPNTQQSISSLAAGSAGAIIAGSGAISALSSPDENPDIAVGGVTNTGIGFSVIIQLLPIEPTFHYVVPLMNTLYGLFVLSQVQLLLISASGLIFAILMAVGLVARAFGITRTFGGAMIAFALGIGIIYPLMTAISYGFLGYAIDNAGGQFLCTFGFNPGSGCELITGRILAIMGDFFKDLFYSLAGNGASPFTGTVDNLSVWPDILPPIQAFMLYGGLVGIGLTFIPILNLTVVDAFIVDFSRVIGERMDFLSLLTRLA